MQLVNVTYHIRSIISTACMCTCELKALARALINTARAGETFVDVGL